VQLVADFPAASALSFCAGLKKRPEAKAIFAKQKHSSVTLLSERA